VNGLQNITFSRSFLSFDILIPFEIQTFHRQTPLVRLNGRSHDVARSGRRRRGCRADDFEMGK
jgi:hypothetical protein